GVPRAAVSEDERAALATAPCTGRGRCVVHGGAHATRGRGGRRSSGPPAAPVPGVARPAPGGSDAMGPQTGLRCRRDVHPPPRGHVTSHSAGRAWTAPPPNDRPFWRAPRAEDRALGSG